MSEERPFCSIVIRAYNEERHIGRLLEGIQQQNVTGVEVILVDSGSTDATLSVAARFPVQIASISPQDFSFGRALNRGCAMSKGDLIVVASAHVFPLYRDWLETLLAAFADEKVALTYGKQRGAERTRLSEARIFARWFADESDPNQSHPFCNNANAAVRRSIWEEFRYDETLTGLEDIDWARRVMQAGYRIAYSAEATVAHVHDESYRRIYNRYRREAIALKRIFPEERFGLTDFARLALTNITADAAQALRGRSIWRDLPDIVAFRLMQFWGTYRGHARHRPVTSELRRRFYYPPERPIQRSVKIDRVAVDYQPDERSRTDLPE